LRPRARSSDGINAIPGNYYAERAAGDYRKFRSSPNGLGMVSGSALIPDLLLGSGIIPGQPTESIKIKPRDFR
jgi:hypothetical protein